MNHLAPSVSIPLHSAEGVLVAHALVDAEDAQWLSGYTFWYSHHEPKGYAVTDIARHRYRLHRMVMESHHGDITGQMVDHINGDTLDNRKANLRLTDSYGNGANMAKRAHLQYKGVFKLAEGKFKAYVRHRYTRYHIGTLEEQHRVEAMLRNPKKLRGTSRYRGVSQVDAGKWLAAISVNNRSVKLGRFDTQEEAALAYNEAALKHHGTKARLNTIPS